MWHSRRKEGLGSWLLLLGEQQPHLLRRQACHCPRGLPLVVLETWHMQGGCGRSSSCWWLLCGLSRRCQRLLGLLLALVARVLLLLLQLLV